MIVACVLTHLRMSLISTTFGSSSRVVFAVACGLMAGMPATPHADDDVAAGKLVYGLKCLSCHPSREGAGNAAGPNLFGIVGRKIGSQAGFDYSSALLATTDGTWSLDRLDRFTEHPQVEIAGTRMAFPGLPDPAQRRQLIAFLQTLERAPAK